MLNSEASLVTLEEQRSPHNDPPFPSPIDDIIRSSLRCLLHHLLLHPCVYPAMDLAPLVALLRLKQPQAPPLVIVPMADPASLHL